MARVNTPLHTTASTIVVALAHDLVRVDMDALDGDGEDVRGCTLLSLAEARALHANLAAVITEASRLTPSKKRKTP